MKNIVAILTFTLSAPLFAAGNYAFNCSGQVCGGVAPYSSCSNARVTIHTDLEMIEGSVGYESFNSRVEKLNVQSNAGKAYAKATDGSVTFTTFPSPKAVIRGFGLKKVELNCRAYRFERM